jgi:hypothetical protein
MTQEQQHPITPPLELVEQWRMSAPRARDCGASAERWIVWTAAAWFRNQYQPKIQAAADQELEACVKLANEMLQDGNSLRAARRPNPLRLKEEALAALGPCPEARPLWESDPGYPTCGVIGNAGEIENWKTIRAALEALND